MSKVFIGMPVYNGERFIREAIESIISQSFTEWVMLISDDVSTDSTPEICLGYANKDPRITYFRQEKNLGIFANFKFVMDKANAEFFIWAAQDDTREKDYLKVCVEYLQQNKNLGLATTRMAAIDSFARTLIEELDLIKLSGKPSLLSVARYILQPEILGKCNLMYGLFRTDAVRKTWQTYPQRNVWGQDYMFSLALISHFEVHVDERILFKKRLGGISSPEALSDDKLGKFKKLEYKNPKNMMFPFGRFEVYFNGHMEALRDTPYRLLAAVLLLARLPRAFFIHLKERRFKSLLKKYVNNSKS